jgi:hypothetical protein
MDGSYKVLQKVQDGFLLKLRHGSKKKKFQLQ